MFGVIDQWKYTPVIYFVAIGIVCGACFSYYAIADAIHLHFGSNPSIGVPDLRVTVIAILLQSVLGVPDLRVAVVVQWQKLW